MWNVRGLNDRARRSVVQGLLSLYRPSLVCLQETKVSCFCNVLATETLGSAFDYDYVPSFGVVGGILLGWNRDEWTIADVHKESFFISARLTRAGSPVPWWITVVYGPQEDQEKVEFLDGLLRFREGVPGASLLCGDFNMIYRARDKSNGRLDRRCMRRFRSFLDRAQLEEIAMVGRRFTWSNERDQPTLELLDRMFASTDWFDLFPSHVLYGLFGPLPACVAPPSVRWNAATFSLRGVLVQNPWVPRRCRRSLGMQPGQC